MLVDKPTPLLPSRGTAGQPAAAAAAAATATALDVAPDGAMLAVGTADGSVELYARCSGMSSNRASPTVPRPGPDEM
jgi:hypothetical protein